MKRPIVIIGCGKAKLATKAPARDLYTGSLFATRRRYAESRASLWFVVSAKHGLLSPDEVISPYDQVLSDLLEVDRAAWAVGVVGQLLDELDDHVRLRDVAVEIHSGTDYADPLHDVMVAVGMRPVLPLRGLGIGEQLAWYAQAQRYVELESPQSGGAS